MNEILRKAKQQTYLYALSVGIIGVGGCYPLYLYIYCEQQCSDSRLIMPLLTYVGIMLTVVLVGMAALIQAWKKSGFVCPECHKPPFNPMAPPSNINKCAGCGRKIH